MPAFSSKLTGKKDEEDFDFRRTGRSGRAGRARHRGVRGWSESTNATRCSPLACCQRSGKKPQVSAPRSSTCASHYERRSQACIKARLASQRTPARSRVTRAHWYLAARRPSLESQRARCPASFSACPLVFAFRVETCVSTRGLCAQNDIRDVLSLIKSDIAEWPPETLCIAQRKWLGKPKAFRAEFSLSSHATSNPSAGSICLRILSLPSR